MSFHELNRARGIRHAHPSDRLAGFLLSHAGSCSTPHSAVRLRAAHCTAVTNRHGPHRIECEDAIRLARAACAPWNVTGVFESARHLASVIDGGQRSSVQSATFSVSHLICPLCNHIIVRDDMPSFSKVYFDRMGLVECTSYDPDSESELSWRTV